ncbi:MAG: HAMP domain-containing histidine kinase [Oscillospiraceae bacterium]|jgi:signal transduction histidine kinase|nr:HAMP domain-containing histidine kinase [Oscillospiraceae bacterium]
MKKPLNPHMPSIIKTRGIRRRWLFNSLAVTFFVVLIAVSAYAAAISAYYYNGMQTSLITKAKTATDFFAAYISGTYSDYYKSAYAYTERFDERDKLEMQFINTGGRVEATTFGLTAGFSPGTPEIEAAISTKSLSIWSGDSPRTGERIIAVTSPIVFHDGRMIGLVRYVSGLSAVDRFVFLNIVGASGIGFAVLLAVAGTNLIFIRSIVTPVEKVTQITKAIADGGYGALIDNKYDDEIGDMVKSINEMSMRISQSEKMKSEFLSSVSHELRTPLTAISGWGETLLYDNTLSNDTRRGLDIILKEAHRLSSMVDELLVMTRIDEGRFTVRLEPTYVEEILEEAMTTYAEIFRRDGITLEYDPLDEPLPELPGDPQRLKQVFLNILDNAAKYGRSGGRVIITCAKENGEKGKTYAVIRVRDFGVGIPEDELHLVKNKFFRGSSNKERGSGIGLSVCDEIIKRHSGHLLIDNAPGGGIIVTVSLPIT